MVDPGRHTTTQATAPERVLITRAAIEVVAEDGYVGTSIEKVLERADVDRSVFDCHFRGKYDCVLSTWHEMNEQCVEGLVEAFESREEWLDGVREIVLRAADSLRSDPKSAAFAAEVMAAGRAARARRDMSLRIIASLIDAGRKEMDDPDQVPHITAEALVGAAYSQLYARVAAGRASELAGLVPQLVSNLVMPYLGTEAALQELSLRPRPAARIERRRRVDTPRIERGEFASKGLREQLIAGFARAIQTHGYAGATVHQIASASSVAPRAFYNYFASKEACLGEAFDVVVQELYERVRSAYDNGGRWPTGVRAGLSAMLEFFSAEPALAHLSMVETLGAGRVTRGSFETLVGRFAPFFAPEDQYEISAQAGTEAPPSTEEAVVRGVLSVISCRIRSGGTDDLGALLPELTAYALAPYLEPTEAELAAVS